MGNCLITKFSGRFQNDNPSIFGMCKVTCNNSSGIGIKTSPDSTIIVKGGTLDGATVFTTSSSGWLVHDTNIVSDGTYGEGMIQLIVPKYGLTRLTGYSIDASELEYSTDLIHLQLKEINNASQLDKIFIFDNFSSLNIGGSILDEPLDISNLGSNGIMTSVGIGGNNINLIGSANKLGMSPLTSVIFPGTKNVSFDVETFVAYNRNSGRTTGSINLKWVGGCDATFNGQPIVNQESNPLSWTASTITLNGTTIDA